MAEVKPWARLEKTMFEDLMKMRGGDNSGRFFKAQQVLKDAARKSDAICVRSGTLLFEMRLVDDEAGTYHFCWCLSQIRQ